MSGTDRYLIILFVIVPYFPFN